MPYDSSRFKRVAEQFDKRSNDTRAVLTGANSSAFYQEIFGQGGLA